MATVIPIEDVRLSERAALFEGKDLIGVSSFITRYERDQGPDLHYHPYPEMFIVQAGTARFTAGDEELVVEAGNIVIVPAETVHGFKNPGDERLEVVSVHPSPEVKQTDL